MTSPTSGTDLSTIPMASPPPGTTSNFVNPESLADTSLWIGILMLVLTALVVIVRLFSNYCAPRGLGWDDCSCVIATLLFLIYVVLNLQIRDFDILPLISETPLRIKELFVIMIINAPMTFFAKSSLFMLYYRLFKTKKIIRYASIFAITFSFMFYSCVMIVSAILCTPEVGHHWDLAVMAKCGRGEITGVFVGIMNSTLDILLLILPIRVILHWSLSVKKKIGILAIFMVGLIALAASLIALVYRIKPWQDPDSTDKIWDEHISLICVMIETGVTIICSSTSALVAFWKSHIAANVVILHSRFCSCYSKLATRFKVVSQTSIAQICPDADLPKSHRNLYKLNYVELDEHHQESAWFAGSIVKTEIDGGSPTSEVEKGVIRKSTKVEQTFC